MRTIRFKGKRPVNGGWVYGSFYEDGDTVYMFGRCRDDNKGGSIAFSVDRETVCQFTGLLDKNGKKIYEGDVLRCNKYPFGFVDEENIMCDSYYGVMVWNKATASFCITTVKNPESSLEDIFEGKIYFIYQDELKKSVEVVGNIHEPEWRQYGEYIQTKEGKEAEDD